MAVKTFLFPFPGTPAICAFQYTFLDSPDDLAGNISLKIPGRREEAIRNREEMLESCPGANAWSECEQVHGSRLLINPAPTKINPENLPEADGMATEQTRLGLLIKTADCQPLMLASGDGRAVMALHIGWRGNRAGFIGAAVEVFCDAFKKRPEGLLAVRGPSLGPTAAEFVHFDEEWGEAFREFYDPATKTVNLWQMTVRQLLKAGVKRENIYGLDVCTYVNDRAFFSWRRDRARGRQGSLVWIDR
ncbi:MAG: polyphenol oxidase family protein [Desulfovibrio sp.]|nr:polyphenol oxidase family protein [Desulfovibrio sp.]